MNKWKDLKGRYFALSFTENGFPYKFLFKNKWDMSYIQNNFFKCPVDERTSNLEVCLIQT